jgi:decaprenylphospho-beta-D-erythro-pentofuranosid-2-ulose 2-reductase
MNTGTRTLLVVGATSGIARALCRRLAAHGWGLVLAARNTAELQRLAADLQTRWQRDFPCIVFDACDPEETRMIVERAIALCGSGLDGVVVCHGMTPQDAGALDEDVLRTTCEVNFLSVAVILNAAAAYLETRGTGLLVAISSVAGDRGRQSHFVYGAAKAALSTYLQGLRNRLHPRGVSVITVKPGFVDTPMTQGMKLPSPLLVASPERVAADIEKAIVRQCDVVYTPWFWRWIMVAIRAIPELLFKRLKL